MGDFEGKRKAVWLLSSCRCPPNYSSSVKYGCWPCLHNFIWSSQGSDVTVIGLPCYPLVCIKKDQTAHSDFHRTAGVCVDLCYVERGLAFPWVSVQASSVESATPLHKSIFQSAPGTGWDRTRDKPALWKCSQRANDLSDIHGWCSS